MNREQLQEAHRVAKLIIGFRLHQLTPQQQEELDDWLSARMENMKLFERLTDETRKDESIEWFKEIDQQTAFYNVRVKTVEQTRKKRTYYQYAAAALLLIIGFAGMYQYVEKKNHSLAYDIHSLKKQFTDTTISSVTLITGSGEKINLDQQQKEISITENIKAHTTGRTLTYSKAKTAVSNTLIVPAGNQFQLYLSDGTMVWLNAQSSLTYPSSFNDSSRIVSIEGEGYFEVSKDKLRPFIVQCRNMMVRVTGTHFTIHSYKNEQHQKVTLIEGGIIIRTGGAEQKITPGQEGKIVNGKLFVTNSTNAEASAAWVKGVFDFNKTEIEEVMNQIAHWYGVKIVYRGSIKKEYTGTILRTSTLEETLNMLEMSGRVHFLTKDKQITVFP